MNLPKPNGLETLPLYTVDAIQALNFLSGKRRALGLVPSKAMLAGMV